MNEINASLGESKGNKNSIASLTVEMGGELKTIKGRRKSEGGVMKHRLRLVVDNRALNNSSAELLFAAYRVALNRWHSTKSTIDRLAARRAYNAWASSFLGDRDSAAVKISSKRPWGFA
jgi:hypothetical protein